MIEVKILVAPVFILIIFIVMSMILIIKDDTASVKLKVAVLLTQLITIMLLLALLGVTLMYMPI